MQSPAAFEELEKGVHTALETYSNVHRGSGHNSLVTTHLYDQARELVLKYMGLNKNKFIVIFCTPARYSALTSQLKPGSYKGISSYDINLPLGVIALAVKRSEMPDSIMFQTGGGTARLVSSDWAVWASAPDRFEAGTPAIINTLTFVRALCMLKMNGVKTFPAVTNEDLTAHEILYSDDFQDLSAGKLLEELKKTLIGKDLKVPTFDGERPFTNLDNSASTPTFTPIWNAFRNTLRQSRQTHNEIIHEVKNICSEILEAPLTKYDIIFTSNTTEAINLVTEIYRRNSEPDIEPVVVGTLLEHSSNDLPWRMVSRSSLIRLSIDNEGFVDLNELDTLLREYNLDCRYGNKRIRMVAVTGASNVLGTYNDLYEISRIVHRYGALLLVDAAQMVAHRKVEMEQCNIDFLAFSAHKVYAPFGTGALVVRKGLHKFNSAELEHIIKSGEENPGGIAAIGKSLLLLRRIGFDLIQEEELSLTKYALQRLSQVEGLTVYGIKDPNSPRINKKGGIIVFSLKGIMANKLAYELAERGGIGVRYGCHCAHILIKHLIGVGPGLEKFQRTIVTLFHRLRLPGIARISFGIENSEKDVDNLIHVLNKIASKSKPKTNIKYQINEFVKTATSKVYPGL